MSNSIDEANLKKFYEFTKSYPTNMYDNVPYECDYDLCTKEKIKLKSGNLVKYTDVSINSKICKINSK